MTTPTAKQIEFTAKMIVMLLKVSLVEARKMAAADSMLEALRPFAEYACDEPHVGEPNCHNCAARAAIDLTTPEAG